MIRRLGPADLEILLAIPAELFDNPVSRTQAKAFLKNDLHEIVMAFSGDLAVGFASGSILLHPDKEPSMFINEVGVRDEFQRRGIGKKVTQALVDLARDLEMDGVWLGTENDNTAALALYRSMDTDEVAGVYFGWDGALDED
ncbi:MAG: GNAT family N-acetyltransferase [Paracoccaceae bacterium]